MSLAAASASALGETPRVSVIIPAYNAARHIAEALDSVLAQDYPALEVIVVDDGSADETVDIVARYGAPVRLLRQANAGAAAARNRGLEAASGAYIAFLDADDVWLPGKLAAQIAYMEDHSEIGLTCGRWLVWHADGAGAFPEPGSLAPSASASEPVRLVAERSGWLYHQLLLDVIVWTSTVVVRHEIAQRIGGFDEDFRRGQDYDYWLRASRLTPIHTLDRPLALYRQHADNITRKCPERNYAIEVIDGALARWGSLGPDGTAPDPGALRDRRVRLWLGYAHQQLRANRADAALRAYLRALSSRPLAPRHWLIMTRGGGLALLLLLGVLPARLRG